MLRYAFVTVTDHAYFPGTLATVNSVYHFHPGAPIYVVANHKHPLTSPQAERLQGSSGIRLVDSRTLDRPGRHINSWELKAYACHDLCDGYDVLVCIDSDCLLCSNVDDVIERCRLRGGFAGGRDGDGPYYDASYAVYGATTPSHNPNYMSTSLLFCAVNDENRRVLRRWADCVGAAEFNGTGPHPGHGDQGVLNAVLFTENRADDLELLDNRLWSQHWTYWDSIIEFDNRRFVNLSAGGSPQRAFHCGGAEKFWTREHRRQVFDRRPRPTYAFVWFLAMLWFGRHGGNRSQARKWLPSGTEHLLDDLPHFFPEIVLVHPSAVAAPMPCSD